MNVGIREAAKRQPPTPEELRKVAKATAKLSAARRNHREAILEAHDVGLSTRLIALAAGVSHTQIQRLLP